MSEGETNMEWCVSMPKVELHAHLNGSIRDSTLLELARVLGEKGVIVFSDVEHVILKKMESLNSIVPSTSPFGLVEVGLHFSDAKKCTMKNDRSLREVFKLFDLIHILTTDHTTVTRITKEVIEDFASENVVYLELRTTPKKNDSIGMTKRSYLEAVMEGLRAVSTVDVAFPAHNVDAGSPTKSPPVNDMCNGPTRKKIYVRLLLSIDRRESTAAAMETVKLALEMKDLGVVGIDLSGNPVVGEWNTFLPALQFAREHGLYITLHCGEVPNPKEIQAMLDFIPRRIGHACYFEEDDWKKLKSNNIPVEICLTSNIVTASVSSLDVHHFANLYSGKHPLVLCTDDAGVFSTNLSSEYNLAASAFGLGKRELFLLAKNAIEYIFASDGVKQDLRRTFDLASNKMDL